MYLIIPKKTLLSTVQIFLMVNKLELPDFEFNIPRELNRMISMTFHQGADSMETVLRLKQCRTPAVQL